MASQWLYQGKAEPVSVPAGAPAAPDFGWFSPPPVLLPPEQRLVPQSGEVRPIAGLSMTMLPTLGEDDASIGTKTWSNPQHITNAGADWAQTIYPGASLEISHYLKGTGFGFSIPAASKILGIEVVWERRSNIAGRIQDHAIRIIKGGTIGSSDRSWPGYYANTIRLDRYGSPWDLWGETWMPSDVNAANFGAAMACQVDVGTSCNAEVYSVEVTVWYDAAPPDTGWMSQYQRPIRRIIESQTRMVTVAPVSTDAAPPPAVELGWLSQPVVPIARRRATIAGQQTVVPVVAPVVATTLDWLVQQPLPLPKPIARQTPYSVTPPTQTVVVAPSMDSWYRQQPGPPPRAPRFTTTEYVSPLLPQPAFTVPPVDSWFRQQPDIVARSRSTIPQIGAGAVTPVVVVAAPPPSLDWLSVSPMPAARSAWRQPNQITIVAPVAATPPPVAISATMEFTAPSNLFGFLVEQNQFQMVVTVNSMHFTSPPGNIK